MRIEKRLSKVYAVTCDGHRFHLPTSSLTAECPSCGQTALMVELVTRFWLEDSVGDEKALAGAD